MPDRSFLRKAIWGLGLTQIIGYGTLYYSFSILAPAMAREFGLTQGWVFGALSASLFAGSLFAPTAGRWADRFGAGRIMTVGSVAAATALALCAMSPGRVTFVLALLAMELASSFVLYSAAFVAIVQIGVPRPQRSITHLTLIAGFASTLFWPLTSALLGLLDWRGVYRLYGVSQLLVCVPLHLAFLPGRVRRPVASAAAQAVAEPPPEAAYLQGAERRRAFLLLAFAFSLQGFVVSAMAVHMLTLLRGFGLAASVAVGIGAMLGPSQVAGRLVELLFGRAVPPVTTAWVSACLMPIGLLLLLAGGGLPVVAGAFAVAFGISMGLSSIVRGTVPLQLFGPVGFGAMMGRLSAPGLVIKAAAPLVFAVSLERGGVVLSTLVLVGFSALAAAALFVLARSRPA